MCEMAAIELPLTKPEQSFIDIKYILVHINSQHITFKHQSNACVAV